MWALLASAGLGLYGFLVGYDWGKLRGERRDKAADDVAWVAGYRAALEDVAGNLKAFWDSVAEHADIAAWEEEL